MKLFSTKEITDKKQAEQARDALRTKDARETLDKLTTNLNESEARFNVALANQRVRWAKEEEEHMKTITSLTSEVKVLERRKKEALVPIEERENKSYDLLKEAEAKLAEAEEKLSDYERKCDEEDHLTELLQDHLDSLSDREEDVFQEEQDLRVKKENFEVFMEEARRDVSEKDNQAKEILHTMLLRDLESEKRDELLKEREDKLNKKERALNERDTLLKDKYDTLQRTITKVSKS